MSLTWTYFPRKAFNSLYTQKLFIQVLRNEKHVLIVWKEFMNREWRENRNIISREEYSVEFVTALFNREKDKNL